MAIKLNILVKQVGEKRLIFLVLPNEECRELGKLYCYTNTVTKEKNYNFGFSHISKLGALADEVGVETMRSGIKTIADQLLALPDQDEVIGEYVFTADALSTTGYSNPCINRKIS